jgi:cytochrome P450
MMKHAGPVIEERLRQTKDHGDTWPDKPVCTYPIYHLRLLISPKNDMMQWLIEEAPEDYLTVFRIANRLLSINFAAIHTSSLTFTHALYQLAEHPEYALILREEVEAVVSAHGWTKAALGKMRKVDSFIRESQRLWGISAATLQRMALKPFAFSNGLTVPAGTIIQCASTSLHTDAEYFDEPGRFNPWRFADMREEDGENMKHQMVATSAQMISFGHGRPAWCVERPDGAVGRN